MSASEAWQAASGLESGEISDVTLRAAFKRIDTNGNGVIEKHELQAALLASGASPLYFPYFPLYLLYVSSMSPLCLPYAPPT